MSGSRQSHSRTHSHSNISQAPQQNETSAALLEQLVYIDNFMNGGDVAPNLDADGQLSMDLAAFADDSFIFPDETKKEADSRWDHALDFEEGNSAATSSGQPQSDNVSGLPKFPVPPGANSSLKSAGLSQNQIDLLSQLVAQHQSSLGRPIPTPSNSSSEFSMAKDETLTFTQSVSSHQLPVHQHRDAPGLTRTQSATTSFQSQMFGSPSSSEDSIYNASPMSSELDKRRRNTAASARFRIKKKMKEKQMEGRIVELSNAVKDFESKIQQLEMENKLLRNLIIEKGSQKSDHEVKLLKEKAKRSD
ncbi:hypothetical protein DICA1_C07316 [Diutina catenulata]